MIIVILGPDGSGKTTIAELLVEAFAEQGEMSRHYAHRFGILPSLSALRPKQKHSVVVTNNASTRILPKYDLRENHPIRTFAYVTWYGLDYFVGGLSLRIKKSLRKDKYIAVFARYFYDYYYQSNNRRLPDQIKGMVEFIVPRPDFIFFLDRDAQEIHDGKPELPTDEIAKQQRIILSKFSRYPQFYPIDARGGAERSVKLILQIVTSQGE